MVVEGLSGNQGRRIWRGEGRGGEELTKTRDVRKNLYGNLPFCKYSKNKNTLQGWIMLFLEA